MKISLKVARKKIIAEKWTKSEFWQSMNKEVYLSQEGAVIFCDRDKALTFSSEPKANKYIFKTLPVGYDHFLRNRFPYEENFSMFLPALLLGFKKRLKKKDVFKYSQHELFEVTEILEKRKKQRKRITSVEICEVLAYYSQYLMINLDGSLEMQRIPGMEITEPLIRFKRGKVTSPVADVADFFEDNVSLVDAFETKMIAHSL